MLWSQGMVSAVLWAGGWADGITQSRSALTLHQGEAHLSFLAQPRQGKPPCSCLRGMLLSPRKWLSPTSSFPPPVLSACSHISLLVAAQCNRLGKWPVLKLPCHQQKQIAIFNLPSFFQERESEVFMQPWPCSQGCQTSLSLFLRSWHTLLVQLLWPNMICHSQVLQAVPEKWDSNPPQPPYCHLSLWGIGIMGLKKG